MTTTSRRSATGTTTWPTSAGSGRPRTHSARSTTRRTSRQSGQFGTNLTRTSDPALDKDFADGLATTDLTEQAKIYGDAQQRITDQVLVFPQYAFKYVLGESDKVHGVAFEPQAFPTFYDAYKAS